MTWLWIILRYLFPRDPLRQTAEAMRVRAAQLVEAARDAATIQLLQNDPNARLHLELVILDAEDCLRSWISMRGCQIARVRPTMPWSRATPHLTHAKTLGHLLARIRDLVIACDEMEQRAQAHAEKLKRLREADPLGAHGSTDAALRAAAHHEAVGVSFKIARSQLGLILRDREAIVSKDEAVLTARSTRAQPGAPPLFDVPHHPQPASEAPLLRSRPLASLQAIPLTPPESMRARP